MQTLIVLFLVLTVFYITFLIKILIGLKKIELTQKKDYYVQPFVSVIIPFRNEEEKILQNLNSIQNQNYDVNKYEVIYVNDNSDDNSLSLLKKGIKNKNIKVISTPESNFSRGYKKRAIENGIQNSKGEFIITTDADCVYSREWLNSMINCFDEKIGFVSGPVEFESTENIWGKIQQLEFAGLIITGAGLIGAGNPIICNAANLAFRKNVFYEVNGYKDNLNLSSGDDEFLMQKISKLTDYEVKFCCNKNAKVLTGVNNSLREFYNQRKRWASKGLFYFDKLLVIQLILIFLFYLSLLIQPILGLLINSIFLWTFAFSFLAKLILEYLILKKGNNLLYGYQLDTVFLFAEFLHVPYIVIAAIAGLFGNYNWKDRKVVR